MGIYSSLVTHSLPDLSTSVQADSYAHMRSECGPVWLVSSTEMDSSFLHIHAALHLGVATFQSEEPCRTVQVLPLLPWFTLGSCCVASVNHTCGIYSFLRKYIRSVKQLVNYMCFKITCINPFLRYHYTWNCIFKVSFIFFAISSIISFSLDVSSRTERRARGLTVCSFCSIIILHYWDHAI